MTRAVLDVNVLVSGFPTGENAPGLLIEYWLAGRFGLVVSEHLLAGTQRAWTKVYFRRRYSASDLANAVDLLRSRSVLVTPTDDVQGVADDWEDDLVFATAVAGQADYLVTGDNGLLRLGTFRGTRIVTLREFLSLLESEEPSSQR